MSWRRNKDINRAGRLISEAYERKIAQVRVPPYPAYDESNYSAPQRSRTHHGEWSTRQVRAVNLAFTLFFALSFSIVGASIGKPIAFASHLVPRVERHNLTEQLPQALSGLRNRLAAGLIGG